MSDLLYQSAFMLQIEEMRLQAERSEQARKSLQDNLEMNKEVFSEITQDIYTENFGYDIIPPADNGNEKETDSKGMEYYENYVQDDHTFEEINPMSEISNTRNSIIFSGKRDCSIQTDDSLGGVNNTYSETKAKLCVENSVIPLKKMELDIEELKKK
jgi:hypothetical protein